MLQLTQHGDIVCVLHPPNLPSIGVNVLEALHVVDGEHDEEALPRPHVLVPHRAVLLLAGRVQDIQETGFSIDHNLGEIETGGVRVCRKGEGHDD